MVSIKSLAVILFAAAAVTAIPIAGGDSHGNSIKAEDKSQRCANQEQKMFCCNDATDAKAVGSHTGVLEGTAVKCNTVPVNVFAVDVVPGASQCNAKAACCTEEKSQNGVLNIAAGCVAWAGPN